MNFPTVPPEDFVQWTQRLYAMLDHLDARRYDAMTALFTPQGRWIRQGQAFEGRAAILQALQARPANMRVRHLLSNPLVHECSAQHAVVAAHMTAYRQLEGGPSELFSINAVSTRFERVDGQWLIAEQSMVREYAFCA